MFGAAYSHFHNRAEAITGLMAGTVDAADVVALTSPAAEALGLLVPTDGLSELYLRGRAHKGLSVTRADFEPWRRQLLAVVAALLDRWLGEDQAAWLEVVRRAGTGQSVVGVIGDAIDDPESPESPESTESPGSTGSPDRSKREREHRAPRWPRGIDASAVLLAMAPPGVAEAFLEDCVKSAASRGILTRMLDRGPLLPLFVDHALGETGTEAMRAALQRNPATGSAGLRQRVLGNPTNVEVLEQAYFAPEADRALRIGCVRRAEVIGGFRPRFAARLVSNGSDVAVLEPLLASGDPQLVHWVLRRINSLVTTPTLRWAGYATLARTAGPEPVWALEQERVGALARMADPVRASLASGDIGPILAAAEKLPPTVGPEGSEMELGAPLIEPWPYRDLIRDHVAGDAHRLWMVTHLRKSEEMARRRAKARETELETGERMERGEAEVRSRLF